MSGFGEDPRLARNAPESLTANGDGISVGNGLQRSSPLLAVAFFAVLAIVLFLYLNGRRTAQADSIIAPVAANARTVASPPPLDLSPSPPVSLPAPAPVAPPQLALAPLPTPAQHDDTLQRLHAPSVVVDLQSNNGGAIPLALNSVSGAERGATAPAPGSQAKSLADSGGDNGPAPQAAEALAATASPLLAGANGANSTGMAGPLTLGGSDATPPTSIASQMTNLATTITQGATIPAVMETAINSDLPGYTRAIVSRDVRGFDGKAVLIPRGSRVIGQYRSALSLGQSRVFVIWSRVIRPDGVTVQIGSPGGDALGRGGLDGDVDSHFFSRFGGAILLSVLNAGVTAIAGTPSTQISIGSPAAAVGAATSATIPTGSDIVPTITVPQGATVNIFVARDLDFSNVGPVRQKYER